MNFIYISHKWFISAKTATLRFDISRFLSFGWILGRFGRLTLQLNLALNFILVDEIHC